MEILEPKDLKPLFKKDYEEGRGNLKRIGREEIYIEHTNGVPTTSLIPIAFGEGTLEEKVKKFKEMGVNAEIIRDKNYKK